MKKHFNTEKMTSPSRSLVYSNNQLTSLRLGDVISSEWNVTELSGFYVFLENDKTDLRQFFFRI